MSDEKLSYQNEHEREYNRLREIEKQESLLRDERVRLLQERPWYKKLTTWFGIFAVTVPILLFTLNYFISQQKTQLTISYDEPRTLVFLTASVRSRAELLFDNKPIENIWRARVYIKNTGTMSIDSGYFKDGPIKFTISISKKEKDDLDKSGIPLILDVVKISEAGQKQDILKIAPPHEPAEFTYMPSLLNPGESVELEIYLSEISNYKLSCQAKLANGKIALVSITDTISKKLETKPYKVFGGAIINLFGSKWLSIVILVIALAMSSLMSLVLYSYGEDEGWQWPQWPLVVTFIFGLMVCVLFLTGIIVTVIY